MAAEMELVMRKLDGIKADLEYLKSHIIVTDIEEIKEPKKEYLEKLKELEKEKGVPFKDIKELRKIIEE